MDSVISVNLHTQPGLSLTASSDLSGKEQSGGVTRCLHHTSFSVAQDHGGKFPGTCVTILTQLLKPGLFHPLLTKLIFLILVQDLTSIFVKLNIYAFNT